VGWSMKGEEMSSYIHVRGTVRMKSTIVQTLGAVTLHVTKDCTDDASIVALGPLTWAIV